MNIRRNENTITKQLIKRSVTVSHRIGKGPRRSSSQPVYHVMISAEKQQLEIKEAQLEKQTNTEHEVNLQMKRAYLCAQRNRSDLIEKIWCGESIQNIKNKKVKKSYDEV